MEALTAPPKEPEPEVEPEVESDLQPDPIPDSKPIPEPASIASPQPKGEGSCLNALRLVLRALVRIFLIILFGIVIGLLVYFGVPWLNNRFVAPLDQHEQRLTILETDYAQRLKVLEDELQAQDEQITDVFTDLDELDQSLVSSQATQTAMQEQSLEDAEALRAALVALEQQLAALDTGAIELQTALDALQERLDQSEAEGLVQAADLMALKQETQLLKAMSMLSRARLFLMQNNLGLAQLDMEAAQATLLALRPDLNETEARALDEILVRLNLARQHLYTAPVLVVDDLEVAWQLLLRGLEPLDLPPLQVLVTITPMPDTTQPISPTLTLEPSTPTPAP